MVDRILRERYQIQRQLGKRLDQETLLALDQETNELVVVKLLIFNHDLKWETFKLFEREAQTLKELSHPAIPRYLDYFDIETTSGKGFALVQSYIDAPSLVEQVKGGRTFSENELKQIAKAILYVLNYLHNRYPPTIHRDIKPSNILLANRSGNHVGQVYLVDFGSVQAGASEGGTRTIVGTYGYMPPEQFGERAVPASDLYGLGTTLIYLASGQHPADLPQKNLRICFENYVSFSPNFRDWLQWMTEPSLEQRLESSQDALQALEQETLRKKQLLAPVKPTSPKPVKPTYSKVVLTKKNNFLEIYIPPKGFSRESLPLIGITVLCNLSMVGVLSLEISLITIMFFGIGLLLILAVMWECFGQVWLRIDQEKISVEYEQLGIRFHYPSPAPRNQVFKLERTLSFYDRDSEGNHLEIKPQINIWAGTKKFSIGVNGSISEIEIDWLANELSDWLGLQITEAFHNPLPNWAWRKD